MGLITDNESVTNQVIDIGTRINKLWLFETLMSRLEKDDQGFNSIYMMMHRCPNFRE